jgi:hypothetical protein
VPRSVKSSRAKISFSVDVSNINTRLVKLNAGVVALGSLQGGNYIFSIPENISVTPDSNGIAIFNNVEIYEGTFLKKTFNVDNSQANAKYILPNANIDTSTVRVSVTGTTTDNYELYTNIFTVESNSKIFLIQEIDDEKYQILFGDNIFGKNPENGSTITASYIVTNGIDGNGSANFTFSGNLSYTENGIDKPVTSGISLLTTLQSSENGDGIESIDTIKYLAPRVYASQYRAVTSNDYTSLIPFLYSNVDSVSAYGGEELDPPQYGKVYITIKPKNGEILSDVTKNSIKNNLKKYTVAGIKQEFIDLKYLYVEYDSTVSYDPSFVSNKENLYTRIQSTINLYSKSSDINSFGGRIKYSKLISLIDNVDKGITSNITLLKMRRNLSPAYNILANYELCFVNKFHADVYGFNIRSTPFRISGVDGDIYLTDLPDDSTGKKGKIRFFTLIDGSPNFINNNAGTVNYEKGEIILYPVTIVSTGSSVGIEVEVVPDSNDIIAKENLYIVLDTTSNSLLNLIEDPISSGSNKSGNSYVPPSSYTSNKKYTR